jgi:hypothetical protein
VDIETTINIIGGRAGLVFDLSADGSFKFAALLSDTQQVVLGHYTPGGGFVVDAVQSYSVKNNLTLEIIADANVVNVNVNGRQVLSYTYGAVITGGRFGLLSWTGSNTFDSLEVRTNDPNLQCETDLSEPPELQPLCDPTLSYQTSFTKGPLYLDPPISGTWSIGSNGYTGTAPAGGVGIVPIDLGLALGLPAGTFTLHDGSAVDISTVFKQIAGRAGFVFDMSSNGSFKFAALLYDTQQVVIGHYTTAGGFVFDAVQHYAVKNNLTFEMIANGDLVDVNINGCQVLSYAYGTVVTRGRFGLLSWTGTNIFSSLTISTNDPGLSRSDSKMHMFAAGTPTGPAVGETALTMSEVDSELGAAIDRLAAMLSLDAATIAELWAAKIQIGDLPDNGLGLTIGDTITISPDAAGWGWFIDPNPHSDSTFAVMTANGLAATPGSAASGEMDLLTVEMHELAHLVGYQDTSSGLMSEYLTPGTRLAPPVDGSGVTSSVGVETTILAGNPVAGLAARAEATPTATGLLAGAPLALAGDPSGSLGLNPLPPTTVGGSPALAGSDIINGGTGDDLIFGNDGQIGALPNLFAQALPPGLVTVSAIDPSASGSLRANPPRPTTVGGSPALPTTGISPIDAQLMGLSATALAFNAPLPAMIVDARIGGLSFDHSRMLLASFEGALAPSTLDQLIGPIDGSDASPIISGDDATELLMVGPMHHRSVGSDSDRESAGNSVAPEDLAALGFASSRDLIRAIQDSGIAIRVSDPGAASDENIQTWLFDEASGDFVAREPESFTIVIDGDGPHVVPQSAEPSAAFAVDTLMSPSASWLGSLRDLGRTAARAWFDI